MDKATLDTIIAKIKDEHSSVLITPRDLFGAFGFLRRTSNNCWLVYTYLAQNEVLVEPHYNDVWVDTPIELKEKTRATRKVAKDPIQRLKVIAAANNKPLCVQNNTDLDTAITLMLSNKYSQLPITDGNNRNLSGYISWESISAAVFRGVDTGIVKDYKSTEYIVMKPDDSLLLAMQKVHEHDFVIVVDKGIVIGIITQQDLSKQFLKWTKPFLLLEEIENHIRKIIDGQFLLEELKEACITKNEEINNIDDLTFGDYLAVLGKENLWNKLGLCHCDRNVLLKQLNEVRIIRNDVMHFDPEGLTREQCQTLENAAYYLRYLSENKNIRYENTI